MGGTLAEDITLNIDSVPTILHAWEAIAMELTNQSHRCSKDGFEDSWFSQWDTADQDVTRLKELDYALPNLTQVKLSLLEAFWRTPHWGLVLLSRSLSRFRRSCDT